MLLEDIIALNKAVKLQPPYQLTPFSPVHAQMLDINHFDQVYFDTFSDYPGMLGHFSKLGNAYTGTWNGKPMCCFGGLPLWPGVAEFWMVPDRNLSSVARPFHRAAKLTLDIFMSEWRLFRLQVTVNSHNVAAVKWIKKMQFIEEGRLAKYGPDGTDYFMFSRLEKPDERIMD